jgi:hypothetical protein
MILLGLAAYEAHNGTDVMKLSRPLGIGTTAVVGAYNGIAGIEKRADNSTYIGHTLTIVVKPGTAVDMDNYRIAVFLLFRQIDVAGMVSFSVAGIIDILPHLRGLNLCLFLHSPEASGWLCQRRQEGKKGINTQVDKTFHIY